MKPMHSEWRDRLDHWLRMLRDDFYPRLQGKEVPGSRLSSIDRSVESHLVALAAERSRLNGGEPIEMY
ncbi:MAG: hypothetical protein Q4C10_00460 [Clostridia bacterium]|nr:hypothetical protein [Clostridia bacterium]